MLPLPESSAAAAIDAPVASVPRTANSAALSNRLANAPIHVIAASAMNQKPSAGNAPLGSVSAPVANSAFRIP